MGTPGSLKAPACPIANRRRLLFIGAITLMLFSGAPLPARAADPGTTTESAIRGGPIRSVLTWAIKILKWLTKWIPGLAGLIKALEELVDSLNAGRRTAELERRYDDVKKRLDEVETRLAKDGSAKAGSARVVVRQLRTEIDRQRRYKPCGIGQHNGPDGTCVDRRLLDRPTAPQ